VSDIYALAPRFRRLFSGLDEAFGTGDRPGRWIKRPPRAEDFVKHLQGVGPGIGIAPLCPDNHVRFAAIDLDEPDFETARFMQNFIPGSSFIERTRSGNVHVWVFFESPCPAWVAMGILRDVCVAAEKPDTEVFPKNWDFARVKLGNYINLPYHGRERPVLTPHNTEYDLHEFISAASTSLNDPRVWEKRADMMQLTDPAQRKGDRAEFGQQDNLHMCAEHIIANAESNPLVYGHQSNTMFLLAKQLSNWRLCDHDEALAFMRDVNRYADPGLPDAEIQRILRNAEEKQYTSTGCDDPIVAPYIHPDCPIANPRRSR
jgi:hypothetical protein